MRAVILVPTALPESFMLKQNLIEELNTFLQNVSTEASPIFQDGSEEEIMLLIEKYKRAYAFLKEKAKETAKKRRLKKLKTSGGSYEEKGLLERLPSPKRGKPKPQTKEDKLQALADKLGVDLSKLK